MKVCTCFMLIGIFACTNSTTRHRSKVHHRSINPAIENVSELNKEEYSEDNKVLDNAHHFIAEETTASDLNKNNKHGLRAARTETFTDFIQEAVNILNTYEETAFEDFFHILDTEIRKYHYSGCRFSELTQNQDTRNFLAAALKIIREESIDFTKENINNIADMMRDETYGNDVKELLDYINSLYAYSDQKFHRILKEIKRYRKTKSIKAHKNLIQVIRSGLRDILFDHYTALDSNTRRALKERIDTFWNRFKNNASYAKMGNSHEMYEVSEPGIDSIEYSENVMNEDKNPGLYSKNVPQTNLRNKRDRKSKEKYYQQPQDNEPEKDDSSNESDKVNADYTSEEILSGQSFDSSSNSIKQSQERHAEYNTDRYMTLYTEHMSYKSRTTKKTEIIPISANEMAKNSTVPTSAPTYSTEDESVGSKKFQVLRFNYNPDDIKQGSSYSDHDTESVETVKSELKPRRTQENKQGKNSTPVNSKSGTHGKVHFIGEYNAVIDVQLANTLLLESLRTYKPVPDNNFRYDNISYRRYDVLQTKSVPTRPTIQFQSLRAGGETKSMKPALTKPPSRYSKTQASISLNRLNNTRRNITEEDDYVRKQKQKFLTRHNANGTDLNVPRNFNEYVIKRLDTLEQDIKDFRSMLYDEVGASNATDKYEAKNKTGDIIKDMNVVRLKIENHDFNKENNDGQSTRSNITNTESSTNNVTKKYTRNTTVIYNKNTSQVTSNTVNKNNKELNKDKIDYSETTVTVTVKVTDSTEFEPIETTPATARSKRTTFDYANLRYQMAHINDGLNLGM